MLKKRITLFLLALLLTSCAAKDTATHPFSVHLALEQSEGYTADRYTAQVQPGERVTFTLTPAEGYTLTGAQGGALQRSGGGYTLTGWNTAPDGSGTAVGLGSRVEWQPGLTLYAQWARWTDAGCFDWREYGSGVVITGYHGQDTTLTIPAELDGRPVYAIGKNACAGAGCKALILPPGLQRVEENAFAASGVETVILSDDINSITDYAFSGCSSPTEIALPVMPALENAAQGRATGDGDCFTAEMREGTAAMVYVPREGLSDDPVSDQWRVYSDRIQAKP